MTCKILTIRFITDFELLHTILVIVLFKNNFAILSSQKLSKIIKKYQLTNNLQKCNNITIETIC